MPSPGALMKIRKVAERAGRSQQARRAARRVSDWARSKFGRKSTMGFKGKYRSWESRKAGLGRAGRGAKQVGRVAGRRTVQGLGLLGIGYSLKDATRAIMMQSEAGRDFMRYRSDRQMKKGKFDKALLQDMKKAQKLGIKPYSYAGHPLQSAWAGPFSEGTKRDKKAGYSPKEPKLIGLSKGGVGSVLHPIATTLAQNPQSLGVMLTIGPREYVRTYGKNSRRAGFRHEVGHVLDAKRIDREIQAQQKKYPSAWSKLRHLPTYMRENKKRVFNQEVRAWEKGAKYFGGNPDPRVMRTALKTYAGFSPKYRAKAEAMHRKYTMSARARQQRRMAARSRRG